MLIMRKGGTLVNDIEGRFELLWAPRDVRGMQRGAHIR